MDIVVKTLEEIFKISGEFMTEHPIKTLFLFIIFMIIVFFAALMVPR